MSSENVLVTGATGFIGGHLVAALETRGYAVCRHGFEDGNIATCRLGFDAVSHVFHLAGKSFVPDSWRQPRDFYEVNVLGTVNALEFCRHRGASLTFVSSYVYGKPRRLPISEQHPLQPLNPYAHSKILAEEACRYYRAQFHVPVTIVRPFNIYGPGQDTPFLIPTLIQQALDPRQPQITVMDLRPRRDFLHVRDLVDLLLATLGDRGNGTYNAGSGYSVDIPELVRLVNACLPESKPVISKEEHRPEEVLDVVADISRATRHLHWRPTIEMADGIRETIQWMRAG